MRRVGRWLGYCVLILLLVATGVVVADRWGQPPEPNPKGFVDRAAQYHARIQRSALGVPHITGPKDVDVAFGLAYAHAEDEARTVELKRLADMAALAAKNGIEPHAGHGLTYDNVQPIAAIPQLAELNIGHYLIGEAIFCGLEPAVVRMRELMDAAR